VEAQPPRRALRLPPPGLARSGAGRNDEARAVLFRRPLRTDVELAGPRHRMQARRPLAQRVPGVVRLPPRRRRPAAGAYVLLSRGGVPTRAPRRDRRTLPRGTGRYRDPPAPPRRRRGRAAREAA